MKDKKEEKKSNKKIIVISSILLALLLVLGVSYAWFRLVIQGTNKISITAGKLDLQILDENDVVISRKVENGIIVPSEYALNLTNQIPISNTAGLSQDGFDFKVKNNGDVDAVYDLYLKPLDTTTMSPSVIKYNFMRNNASLTNPPQLLSQATTEVIDGETYYKLDHYSVNSNGINPYNIKIWIDYDAGNEVMEQTFQAILYVKGYQTEEPGIYLPTNYTAVKYLQDSGTQYLNLNLPLRTNDVIEVKASTSRRNSYSTILGSRGRYELYFNNNIAVAGWQSIKVVSDDGESELNSIHNIVAKLTGNSDDNNILFAYEPNSYPLQGRIYSFKIIRNNLLIMSLTPALDQNDVPCMYDNITGTTFYNQGTGTFAYEIEGD